LPQNEVLKLRGRQPCKATCTHFRCGQRALFVRNSNPQNRDQQFKGTNRGGQWEQRSTENATAFCNWVGDSCVVSKCNFAFCEKRGLLPDGSCGYEERETGRQSKSIEDEARREEDALKIARERLLKKTGRDFIE
jgi:hypothetical protein